MTARVRSDRPPRLTPLEEQPRGWRPDWPLRAWLLPVGTAIAAAAVAGFTTRSDGWSLTISGAAWYLLLATAALTTGLAYASSESRWPWRAVFALASGAVSLGATFLVVIIAAAFSCGGG